uniref:Peptidase M20 dimerisation domain-containing protein n=1 Tax=Pyxicephalus adspersus TaxID=30357 RepID=A0AAV3A0P4_PYXAD|nr:TPA: hypothetical protein GDO54_012115 [Pyxicephalus adspersus]
MGPPFHITMLFILSLLSLLSDPVFLTPIQNDAVFHYINDQQNEYIQRLKNWVAIESDSSDPSKRDQVNQMMEITKDYILNIGGEVEMAKIGEQEYSPGVKLPLPPVILAQIGNDKDKPTVCFYGHMDVQPAKKDDGWKTEPYTLQETNGNLFGRGTSDDKGQVLALLHAVESVKKFGLPVNVKLVIEGMEEVGSQGLEKLVEDKKDTFFSDVDYIVVTDTPWLSTKPGITYGARGNCYFMLEVEGAKRDLHSGGFGGTVYEAMSDLIYLLGQLVDVKGKILIPGVYDDVVPLTEQEKELYKNLEFSLDDMQADTGVKQLLHDTKAMFNTDADMIRAGGTIPIAKRFEEILGKPVMLLGIGGSDDAPHGQNEKISKYNYIEGTKLYASFLQEIPLV